MIIWKKNYLLAVSTQRILQKNQKNIQFRKYSFNYARDYLKFDTEKKDLEQIIQDKNNDKEMIEMAQKDLKN